VRGQYKPTVWAKIEEVENFEKIAAAYDLIELLRLIKQILYEVQSHQYLPVVMYKTLRAFMVERQGWTETVQAYYEIFKSHVQVVKKVSGGLGVENKLHQHELGKITEPTRGY